MESKYGFDSRTQLLKVTLIGRVDSGPLLGLIGTLRKLSEQLKPRAVIYDCSAIESVNFDTSFMGSLAGLRPVYGHEVLSVIMAPHEYLYGLGRMYQEMTSERRPNVHVVRNWIEAQNVLGLTEPPRYAEVPIP